MNTKEKYICLFLVVASVFLLSLTFFNNKINFSNLLKASVVDNNTNNNEVINAARNYANDNISALKNETVITVKDLINNKYLTGNEVDPVTNQEYDEKTRIIIKVKNNKVEDIYLTNVPFKNILSCKDVCYMDFDNYISYKNDIYRIIKIDSQGLIYITNGETKTINKNDISSYLKNEYNSSDKSIVSNIVSVSNTDIEKSNVINLDNNIIVNTSSGYKLYNINNNTIQDINIDKVNIIPVIVLKDSIIYEKGNGSKFDPYILGE